MKITRKVSASQLSFVIRGDDVARVHQAMQALGRSVPVSETASRVLCAGTVALLKGLQTDLGGRFRHQQCQDLSRRFMTSLPNLTLIHEWFGDRCVTQMLTIKKWLPFFVEYRNKKVTITSREGN